MFSKGVKFVGGWRLLMLVVLVLMSVQVQVQVLTPASALLFFLLLALLSLLSLFSLLLPLLCYLPIRVGTTLAHSLTSASSHNKEGTRSLQVLRVTGRKNKQKNSKSSVGVRR